MCWNYAYFWSSDFVCIFRDSYVMIIYYSFVYFPGKESMIFCSRRTGFFLSQNELSNYGIKGIFGEKRSEIVTTMWWFISQWIFWWRWNIDCFFLILLFFLQIWITEISSKMPPVRAIICPSILNSNLAQLGAECKQLVHAGADWWENL